jgi:hypothetical protein
MPSAPLHGMRAMEDRGPGPAEPYLDALIERFRDFAARPGAVVVRHLDLGERLVRLELSSGAMERAVMPALAHLEVAAPAKHPDLVIHAWDSDGNGAPPVSPGWGIADYRREGYISGFNDGRFHTAFQSDPVIFRMIDFERGRAAYWTPTAAHLPMWELGAPMRPLLHEWLGRTGLVAVHGGAVGTPEGGAFLAGAGGRGKSNVALASLASPLRYLSDDFCFLSPSPRWAARSLYCTGKIASGDFGRHPHLRGLASNPERLDREKALFFLHPAFRDRLIRGFDLRAIVMPRVVGTGPSRLTRIDGFVARKEIALSTIELSRWTSRESLGAMSALVDALPCYELAVGGDITEAPRLIAELLGSVG